MKRNKLKDLILENKKIVVAATAILVLVGGIGVVKFKKATNDDFIVSAEDGTRTVKLEKGDINKSIIVSGKVQSAEVSNVSSVINAKVKTVNVKVGDVVKAGDIICTLDNSDIVKEIENKKKEISATKQGLQNNYNKLLSQLNSLKSLKDGVVQNQDLLVEGARTNYNHSNEDVSNYERTFKEVKNTYDIMISAVSEKQGNYDNAEAKKNKLYEAWLKSGGKTDSNEHKEYISSIENVNNKKNELDQAKGLYDYDNVRNRFNEVKNIYNEKISARASAENQYNEAIANRNALINNNKTEVNTLESSVNEAYDQLVKADNNEELKALEEKLNNTVLKAETNGKITDLKVKVGSMTEGVVATIQDTTKLILSVNIPESDIQKVSSGMKVLISSDSLNKKINGSLIRVSPTANTGEVSGFAADISIENGKEMFIGTAAKAEIIISGKKDIIMAPIDAVKDIDGKASIIVKESNGGFKEVPVTIGEKNDYYVEVSGTSIKEGMEINANANLDSFSNLENPNVQLGGF